MDPVTINFDGLNGFLTQFGPHGYVIGHVLAALFFGAFAFRQISLAGACKGKACHHGSDNQTKEQAAQRVVGESHVWRAAITSVIGVANVVIAIVMSANLFIAALEKANPTASTSTATTASATTVSMYASPSPAMATMIMDNIRQREEAAELERLFMAAGGVEVLNDSKGLQGASIHFATAADGKTFSIGTLHPIGVMAYQGLKALVSETTGLDSVEGLSHFLEQCDKRQIRVTSIIDQGRSCRQDRVVYDNPRSEPVKITGIPAIVSWTPYTSHGLVVLSDKRKSSVAGLQDAVVIRTSE